MSYGLYKPGQGYWTRVMTACGGGLLALAGALWLWGQLGVLDPSYATYVQASVAATILITATILLYWLVGVNPRTVDFFVATETEMQKVNWSSRREVIGSTWVVIGVSMIIAVLLFVTDFLFSNFFQLIRVLER